MQSAWVERNCEALLGEALRNFVRLCRVIPNAHSLVTRASGNEFLADADVQACDFSTMERSQHVVEAYIFICLQFVSLEDKRRCNELAQR